MADIPQSQAQWADAIVRKLDAIGTPPFNSYVSWLNEGGREVLADVNDYLRTAMRTDF